MPVLFSNTGKKLSLFGELHLTEYSVPLFNRPVPKAHSLSSSVSGAPSRLQQVPHRQRTHDFEHGREMLSKKLVSLNCQVKYANC